MAFELWGRALAKWRGILVYAVLNSVMRLVTTYIFHEAHTPDLRLYASVVGLLTSVFCFWQTWQLLTTDRDGDEAWPPLWS